MVPPHGTAPSEKTHIKQLLTSVKLYFVAQEITQFVAHEDSAFAKVEVQENVDLAFYKFESANWRHGLHNNLCVTVA